MSATSLRSVLPVVVLFWAFAALPAPVAAGDRVGVDSEMVIPEFSVVHIEVSDRSEVSLLEEFIDVWAYHVRKGIVDAAVTEADEQVLRDFGFRYEIDVELTEKHSKPAERLKSQTEGIPGYPCYRTVEETLADGAALAAAYPDLAEWIDIGDSWEKTTPGGLAGYDLMVLRLTNSTNGIPLVDKPKLWVMGSTHAREYTTAETVTRFAEHLLANYDVDPDVRWLLDYHDIHLLLVTNPDGRKHAEAGLSWRKNTNENYCGSTSSFRGADLNRNCDFQWAPNTNQCSTTYPGPSPASEPEISAMQSWVAAHFPDWRVDDLITPAPDNATGIFIDVHSYSDLVLSPFGFRDPPNIPSPNDAQILRLARKFSFYTGYYAQLGSTSIVTGSTKDFAYGTLGVPGFTFELGTAFFQDCGYFESNIYPNNLKSLLYAARAVRAPYILSSGPEVLAPEADPMVAAPGEAISMTAVIDDTRYGPGESSPSPSVEAIAAAEAYVDVPPWEVGAIPISMTADDGLFNSTAETVTATIDTTGLADGRHTIYLRGQDAAGYWGTVRTVWVWVLDPSTAGHISGTVTDRGTGAPIEATVTSGIFTAAAAPATGIYDLAVPAGSYDVTATSDGYGPMTVTGVAALAGVTTTLDFDLTPYQIVFADDVEIGNIGWTTQGSWAITSEASSSPTRSWTDSPGSNYGNGWNYSLTSPTLDLTDIAGTVVEFSHIYELESGWDFGYVEVSANGGSTWTAIATYSGNQVPTWERVEIATPQLDHAADARIRFRIQTDSNTTEDGWHIDDILVRGAEDLPPVLVFSDGFESGDTSAWTSASP